MHPPRQPGAPPGQPTGPKPSSTNATAAPRQRPAEYQLTKFLAGLQIFQRASEPKQLFMLSKMCQSLHPTPSPSGYKSNLPWALKRTALFQSLPAKDQLKYIQDLIIWRRMVFAPIPQTDFAYVAYLLPGLAHYVYSVRTGAYNAVDDGNWFLWWKARVSQRHKEAGTKPSDDIQADRELLEHLMQYEARKRIPVVPRYPDDPLNLPPILQILGSGPALPVMEPPTSGPLDGRRSGAVDALRRGSLGGY
ncbi:hypothetical protein F5Y13DRAFT_198637 [Hypoxylon sp. FL1857]|nr:hypothetical protein F5Y13DRAFT_198637 [Hypoxylon sp. FL1857]